LFSLSLRLRLRLRPAFSFASLSFVLVFAIVVTAGHLLLRPCVTSLKAEHYFGAKKLSF
jgi:hypothetical protein